MATPREQLIELLKQDIEQFETAAKRIEELLPHLGAELQEHWKLTAKARHSIATELRMLLQKAEHPR
jgi:cell division septum initiation protein DivIVA